MTLKNILNVISIFIFLYSADQAFAIPGIVSDEAEPHFSSLRNQETIEDIKVKVLGGYVRMNRVWNGSSWIWNDRWGDITSRTESVAVVSYTPGMPSQNTGFKSVLVLYRAGQVYRKSKETSDSATFESQLNQFITQSDSGFLWTDRKGNAITYNTQGQVTGYYDKASAHVYIERDANGYITRIKDHNQAVVLTYSYELVPGAPVLTNSQGQTYPQQRLVGLTDYSGRSVSYTWNAQNQLGKVTDVRGEDWVYTYEDGLLTQLKDPDGRITRYKIEKDGKFISRVNADGHRVSYTYDYKKEDALYYAAKNIDGQVKETWYNAIGQVVSTSYDGDPVSTTEQILSDNSNGVANIVKNYSSRVEYWYKGNTFIGVVRPDELLPTDQALVNKPIYVKFRRVKDARGNLTVFELDQWKNIVKVTYPDGSTIKYTWDAKYANPLTFTSEKGVVTAYEYNDIGNIVTLTEAKSTPQQRTTRYSYDDFGQVKLMTTGESTANDTALATIRYEYDDLGNITQITDAENNITRFSDFDPLGNARTITDARANALSGNSPYTWKKTFDAAGDLLSELDPYGKGTINSYSKSGDIKTITAADGEAVTLTTNAVGLPLNITDANGKVTKLEYDKANRLTFLTDANGNKTQTVYDQQGRVLRTIDGESNVTQYGYAENLLRTIQYPTYKELLDYDNRDRPNQITQQANSRNYLRKKGYDQASNLSRDTDAQDVSTVYEYDALNRIAKITDANNGVTQFSYDARDNLLQVKDPENRLTIYAYNKNNQLLTETKDGDQNTNKQRRYNYDASGNLLSVINPDQEKATYEYDQANRLVKSSVYANKDHTRPIKVINYDINNKTQLTGWSQQVSSTLPEGVTPTADVISLAETYTYTNLGQLESVTASFGGFTKTYSYSYYPNGLKKTYTNPENITYTYYYNKNNQLIAVHIPGNGQVSYSQFDWLMPQTLLLPGGQKVTYSYTDFLQLKERVLKNSSDQNIASALYEYDLENNIKKIAANDGDYNFTYDNLYRLKTTDVPTANPANDEVFDYDGVGNRVSHSIASEQTPLAETLIHNNKNQLISSTGSNNIAFTYTSSGHTKTQTKNGVITEYIYNHEERLIAVKRAGVILGEYAYNPQGQRVKKTVNGATTWYLYNQNGLAAEYSSSGSFIKEYFFHPQKTWMTDPLFMRTANNEIYYYHNDQLGTPLQLVNSLGEVKWTANYSAFGKANIVINLVENNLRFPGQYFDSETDLHQNYFRNYDSNLGRYIESDPIGLAGGINTYIYAEGNSIGFSDPMGLTYKTNSKLFWDWVYERGDASRYYGPDTTETKEMMSGRGAEKMRNSFKDRKCQNIQKQGYGTIEAYFDTALNPGGTDFQVGGFIYSATNTAPGMVTYRVYNQASIYSFFLHIPGLPHKPRGGAFPFMGNIDQKFEWSEPTPCDCQ